MSTTTPTPDNLAIQLRDYRFGRDAPGHPRWWLSGDPVATAFFNALSATFPLGERFFMDSVKAHRTHATGVLRDQISAFLFQESMHSREHVVFNEIAEKAGYDMKALEDRTRRVLAFARTRTPIQQLAATCALEHFTAILANAILDDSRYLEGAPPEAQALWRWHAMEEIEHKAVAFDTLVAATRGWSPLRRYILRARAMTQASILFYISIGANLRDLYRQDGLNSLATWLKTAGYLLFRPGIVGKVFGYYFAYYRPGFHPWDHDDRALLARAERLLNRDPAAAAPA
ncbi:MAG: metal-dependent hydrolase [Pseudomonadota bacterium]